MGTRRDVEENGGVLVRKGESTRLKKSERLRNIEVPE